MQGLHIIGKYVIANLQSSLPFWKQWISECIKRTRNCVVAVRLHLPQVRGTTEWQHRTPLEINILKALKVLKFYNLLQNLMVKSVLSFTNSRRPSKQCEELEGEWEGKRFLFPKMNELKMPRLVSLSRMKGRSLSREALKYNWWNLELAELLLNHWLLITDHWYVIQMRVPCPCKRTGFVSPPLVLQTANFDFKIPS